MPLHKRGRSRDDRRQYEDGYYSDNERPFDDEPSSYDSRYDDRYDSRLATRGRHRHEDVYNDYYYGGGGRDEDFEEEKPPRKRSLSRRALDRMRQLGQAVGIAPKEKTTSHPHELVRARPIDDDGGRGREWERYYRAEDPDVYYTSDREYDRQFDDRDRDRDRKRGRSLLRRRRSFDSEPEHYYYPPSPSLDGRRGYSRTRSRRHTRTRSERGGRMDEGGSELWRERLIAAADAAAVEAWRLRKEPGSWTGRKGARLATAAISAAAVDSVIAKDRGGRGKRIESAVAGLVVNRLVNGPRKSLRK